MIFDVWLSLKKGYEIELLLKSTLKTRIKSSKLIKKDDFGHQRIYELDDGTKIDLKIMNMITNQQSKLQIENDDESLIEHIKDEIGIN